jgi:hypothetical protein
LAEDAERARAADMHTAAVGAVVGSADGPERSEALSSLERMAGG